MYVRVGASNKCSTSREQHPTYNTQHLDKPEKTAAGPQDVSRTRVCVSKREHVSKTIGCRIFGKHLGWIQIKLFCSAASTYLQYGTVNKAKLTTAHDSVTMVNIQPFGREKRTRAYVMGT